MSAVERRVDQNILDAQIVALDEEGKPSFMPYRIVVLPKRCSYS
jgi:hypothetical protein